MLFDLSILRLLSVTMNNERKVAKLPFTSPRQRKKERTMQNDNGTRAIAHNVVRRNRTQGETLYDKVAGCGRKKHDNSGR